MIQFIIQFKKFQENSIQKNIQFKNLQENSIQKNIQFKNLQFKKIFNSKICKKIQFKIWFKILNLAGFNSTIYSFNNKTWVSLTPTLVHLRFYNIWDCVVYNWNTQLLESLCLKSIMIIDVDLRKCMKRLPQSKSFSKIYPWNHKFSKESYTMWEGIKCYSLLSMAKNIQQIKCYTVNY